LVDYESLSRYFLLEETVKDLDGYGLSDFLYLARPKDEVVIVNDKARTGKQIRKVIRKRPVKLFHVGPWDFDL